MVGLIYHFEPRKQVVFTKTAKLKSKYQHHFQIIDVFITVFTFQALITKTTKVQKARFFVISIMSQKGQICKSIVKTLS